MRVGGKETVSLPLGRPVGLSQYRMRGNRQASCTPGQADLGAGIVCTITTTHDLEQNPSVAKSVCSSEREERLCICLAWLESHSGGGEHRGLCP